MCIDIVKIWFGIADGQISSIFDSYLPATRPYFHFWLITLVNNKWIFTKLGMCIALILWRSVLRLLMGKSSIFIPRHTIVAGYYGFMLVVSESVRPLYVRPSIFHFQMIT